MSDHIAIIITAWATVAAAAAALVAVCIGYYQSRETLREAQRVANRTIEQAKTVARYQLITQFDERWNSSTMRAWRRDTAQAYLQKRTDNPTVEHILDFFEGVARAAIDGIITRHLVWHYFFYWIIDYWTLATDRVNIMRRDDHTAYEDLAALVPELMAYEAKRRGRTINELTPSQQELDEFIKEECAVPAGRLDLRTQ
jgi:hypothetical protein